MWNCLVAALVGLAVAACGGHSSVDTGATATAAQQQADDLLALCHVSEDGTETTIEVASSGVEAHLAHGDTIGPCAEETSEQATENQTEVEPPTTCPGLTCTVVETILTCTASGLQPSAYVALNIDLQDCEGGNYGISGIADGYVDSEGAVTFTVDLACTERFGFGPPPPECSGAHDVMVAYWDGHAVCTMEIIVPAIAN